MEKGTKAKNYFRARRNSQGPGRSRKSIRSPSLARSPISQGEKSRGAEVGEVSNSQTGKAQVEPLVLIGPARTSTQSRHQESLVWSKSASAWLARRKFRRSRVR